MRLLDERARARSQSGDGPSGRPEWRRTFRSRRRIAWPERVVGRVETVSWEPGGRVKGEDTDRWAPRQAQPRSNQVPSDQAGFTLSPRDGSKSRQISRRMVLRYHGRFGRVGTKVPQRWDRRLIERSAEIKDAVTHQIPDVSDSRLSSSNRQVDGLTRKRTSR